MTPVTKQKRTNRVYNVIIKVCSVLWVKGGKKYNRKVRSRRTGDDHKPFLFLLKNTAPTLVWSTTNYLTIWSAAAEAAASAVCPSKAAVMLLFLLMEEQVNL
jgi:hypothetical protein